MIRLSTYYTPAKERVYDADEVDALMVEVEWFVAEAKDSFRVVCEVLFDDDLPREEHMKCLGFLTPRIKGFLKSALSCVRKEVGEDG